MTGLSSETERAPFVDLFVEAGFELHEARAAVSRMREATAAQFEVAGLVQLETSKGAKGAGERASYASVTEAAARVGDDGRVAKASGLQESDQEFWSDIDKKLGLREKPKTTAWGRPISEAK